MGFRSTGLTRLPAFLSILPDRGSGSWHPCRSGASRHGRGLLRECHGCDDPGHDHREGRYWKPAFGSNIRTECHLISFSGLRPGCSVPLFQQVRSRFHLRPGDGERRPPFPRSAQRSALHGQPRMPQHQTRAPRHGWLFLSSRRGDNSGDFETQPTATKLSPAIHRLGVNRGSVWDTRNVNPLGGRPMARPGPSRQTNNQAKRNHDGGVPFTPISRN